MYLKIYQICASKIIIDFTVSPHSKMNQPIIFHTLDNVKMSTPNMITHSSAGLHRTSTLASLQDTYIEMQPAKMDMLFVCKIEVRKII